MIPDSFAGERERHTLEPLLATPLSDRAILFGMISAAVGYGWGITLISMVIGLLATNLIPVHEDLLLYPAERRHRNHRIQPARRVIRGECRSLSLSARANGMPGAAEFRPGCHDSAGRTGLSYRAIFAARMETRANSNPCDHRPDELALAIAAILVILDIALILVTLARFHRTQLLLD